MLTEWHVTPDYVVANWTEELLELMLDKLIERKKREVAAIRGHSVDQEPTGDNVISDQAFFNAAGIKVKHGD